jgi:hypothetical protein
VLARLGHQLQAQPGVTGPPAAQGDVAIGQLFVWPVHGIDLSGRGWPPQIGGKPVVYRAG